MTNNEENKMDHIKFIKELLMLTDDTLFKIGRLGMTGEGRAVADAYVQGAQVEHYLVTSGTWELRTCPAFMSDPERYRARKRMIIVNGDEVPAPEVETPKIGTRCYAPRMPDRHDFLWEGTMAEYDLLNLGLVYLNKDDCKKRRDAMLKFEVVR